MTKFNSTIVFLSLLGVAFVLAQSDTTTIKSSPTTAAPIGGYNCTEDGVFPHPLYCEFYYKCLGGVDTLFECQKYLLYSLRYFGCDWPADTDCGNRTRPEGYPGTSTPTAGSTTTGTTLKPGNFTCPEGAGSFPDPDDCRSYYRCFHQVPTHSTCNFPLMFNPVTEGCDWPGSVDCGTRPVPTRESLY